MNGEIGNAPVFVKIDEYKNVSDTLNLIKTKLTDARNNLNKINEIKGKEDAALKDWESSLENVEKKVADINSALFEQPND